MAIKTLCTAGMAVILLSYRFKIYSMEPLSSEPMVARESHSSDEPQSPVFVTIDNPSINSCSIRVHHTPTIKPPRQLTGQLGDHSTNAQSYSKKSAPALMSFERPN